MDRVDARDSLAARPRILLVDDDADLRAALSELLAQQGFVVATAENGAEALALLRAGPLPTLILLDIQMPTMDGWAFCEERRRDPSLWAIPLMILSARGGPTREAPYLGVEAIIAKPCEPEALLAAVVRVVSLAPRGPGGRTSMS